MRDVYAQTNSPEEVAMCEREIDAVRTTRDVTRGMARLAASHSASSLGSSGGPERHVTI